VTPERRPPLGTIAATLVVTALGTASFLAVLWSVHLAFEALCHAVRQADRKRHQP
jgi:hypothetical protein